jgi:hypothetical protein
MTFIEWCNVNQGFITAIFSLLSLLISTIAIVISILSSRLPYKRAVRVSSGSYFGVGEGMENKQGVYVNALNVGNVPINIIEVGLLHGKKHCINTNTMSDARGVLKQMESFEQSFPSQGLKETFKGKKGRVYAFAKDAEGHIYKKYLCNAKDF